jgi:serpin B
MAYKRGSNYQAIELPYDGDELSMLILVPDLGSLKDVEDALTASDVEALVGDLRSTNVKLALPKFEVRSQMDLSQVLQGFGLQDAFDPARADFSGMDGTRKLYISKVLHEAYVKVDEAGTAAAAATAVILAGSGAPTDLVPLTVDRPFLFLIRDRATRAIIFVGRIVDVN